MIKVDMLGVTKINLGSAHNHVKRTGPKEERPARSEDGAAEYK
jgi:hypothetical protein